MLTSRKAYTFLIAPEDCSVPLTHPSVHILENLVESLILLEDDPAVIPSETPSPPAATSLSPEEET